MTNALSKDLNILLTSAGRRSYMVAYFKEALDGTGLVHAANSSFISTALQAADKHVVTPIIYSDAYIPFLLAYCKQNKIKAIIPLFDIDLFVLACNKEKFAQIGVHVVVSDKEVIELCNDKWKTYCFLKEHKYHTPQTYLDVNEVKRQIALQKLSYPLIVKPRWGMGSIGVYIAEDENELDVFYQKVKNEIKKSYLKYESKQKFDESVLMQEMLAGQEYGLDIINDLQGNYQNTIVKKKIGMRSGETDCAEVVAFSQLKNIGEALSRDLGHAANLDVDVFVCGDKAYILELNARFGGGYPFSHIAGVNLPKAIVKWLSGEAVHAEELLSEKCGVLAQKEISIIKMDKSIAYKIDEQTSLEEIESAIVKGECLLEASPSSLGVDLSAWSSKLFEKGIVFTVKDINGAFKGVAAFYANDLVTKTAYLTLLAVTEDTRGTGLGKRLIGEAETAAKKNGMKFFRLRTRKDNGRAISFYNKNGYREEKDSGNASIYMIKEL